MSKENNMSKECSLANPINSNDRVKPVEGVGNDLDMAIDAFLREQQIMENSRKSYGSAIRRFFRWCTGSGRMVGSLARADVVSYVEGLSMAGYSDKTVTSYIVALRRFYGWLDSKGVCPNITRGIRPPRKQKKGFVKMHLERDEAVRLLKYARTTGLRNYAIVNLMLRNGLRTVEVSRLDVGDITRRRGIRILRLWRKGSLGKDDFVPLTDEAYMPIIEYLETREACLSGSPLFATEGDGHRNRRMSPRRIQQVVKGCLVAVGLTGREYSPHSLRHTTAVAILKNGGSISDVQAVLGHASSATSRIYVKSVEEQMRLENPPENIIRKAFDENCTK